MSWNIIRADSTEETRETRATIREVEKAIGAAGLDSVNLRDGRVMLVDDTGFVDGKPVNPAATEIYHSVCRPGTTHPICGDAAIVEDNDFAD